MRNKRFGVQTGKGSFWRGDRLVVTTREPQVCGPGRGIGTYKLKLTGNKLVLNRTFTKVN